MLTGSGVTAGVRFYFNIDLGLVPDQTKQKCISLFDTLMQSEKWLHTRKWSEDPSSGVPERKHDWEWALHIDL